MTRKLIPLLLCLLLLLSLVPASAQHTPVTLMDMKGREITLDSPVTRIVALSPSDCEILYALGAGDLLVGRGTYCNYPADVEKVPVVESGELTNLEQIVALDPQVLLMSTMAQSKEQVEALESVGIKVVVSDAQTIEGVYTAIGLIGALVGKEVEAEALVGQMQTTFEDIAAKAAQSEKTVYFEVSPLQWGLWAAGKGTFMDELATLCGLQNAFSDVEGWAQVSQEQVLERNPDYIVTTSMYYGEGATPVEEIKSRTGWEGLTAVSNNQVLNADADAITRPGPRLVDAVRMLLDFINPNAAMIPAT